MGSNSKILSGIYWTTIQTVINRSFGFIIKLVLARLLFPEDYGLIGMAVVFTSFIQIFADLGLGSAIIRKDKGDLSIAYLSTAFWSGVVWSVFIFLIVSFIIGPIAANFYEEPLLKSLIPVLSLGILASPINWVHRALMVKEFRFKSLAIINNSSSIFSGIIAVSLAFYGAGVWSLAFNSVANIVIAMPLYFKYTQWKPKWIWNSEDFKDIVGFGVFTTLSGLLGQITSQGDYLLIGKFIGKYQLGLYSFAFILADSLRIQVKAILGKVLYPVYAEFQNNLETQFQIYLKNTFFNSLIITPLMVLLIFGTDTIIAIFGDKWLGSVDIIKIISASVIFESLTVSVPQVLRANNRAGIEFKMVLFKVILLYIPSIILGVKLNGVIGVAYAVLFYRLISSIIDLIVLKKEFNFSPLKISQTFFKGLIPSILSVLSVLLFLNTFESEFKYLFLIKFSLVGVFICLFTYLLYGTELKNMLKNAKKSKR